MKQQLGTNQQAWVDTLRSGLYPQCRGTLQRDSGFCCLGVGAKVAQGAGIRVEVDDLGDLSGGSLGGYYRQVVDFLGLHTQYGDFIDSVELEDRFVDDLIELNDRLLYDFNQIADFIEENAHLVFKEVK